MRGSRACKTCIWFEDKSEEFHSGYVSADGMCHFRMPATIAKDSQGWGSWHQKGSAPVRFEDWCSCHEPIRESTIEGNPGIALASGTSLLLENGEKTQ